ncbi:hypothetical protein KP509_10G086500 [Ceratopteris richardii]|uniref:GDSL esterase/lipase n=1 Tax=Ceratopteris richardii TaxID=49495 RepID=A0A8T2U3J1_CERRI|nr:hypothetical protein KP509_10G086500 [Ceratopteris richardii]
MTMCVVPRKGRFLLNISTAIAVASCCIVGGLNAVGVATAPCYPALFVFGDSLSDTGNGNLTGNIFFTRTSSRPYGETVPGYPFDRFSDGLLLVDFLGSLRKRSPQFSLHRSHSSWMLSITIVNISTRR